MKLLPQVTKLTMLSPLENLKAFAINRPPMVVFTACLAIFAIAALTLSYYLRTGPIPNPDVKVDWNVIMDHMSQWELCVITSTHLRSKPLTVGQDQPFQKHHEYFRTLSSQQREGHHPKGLNDSSVSVSLHLRLGFRATELPKDMDILWGKASLVDLGYEDSDSQDQLSVVIDLGEKYQMTNCTKGDYISCNVIPGACVTFYGPVSVLPRVKDPDVCLSRKVKKDDATFAVLNLANAEATPFSCSGITVVQEFIPDPSFQENLSYNEQTMMNMHLTYTSYFLFVTVMTVLCYATVRGQAKAQLPIPEKSASV